MLAQHEPLPAVVMDRGWNLQRANDGAAHLFTRLFAPAPMPDAANVLRLVVEPGPVRDRITNWDEVVPALVERARREAVGGVYDGETAELVASLRSRPDVSRSSSRTCRWERRSCQSSTSGSRSTAPSSRSSRSYRRSARRST